jgi:hypothetical protein
MGISGRGKAPLTPTAKPHYYYYYYYYYYSPLCMAFTINIPETNHVSTVYNVAAIL